MVYSGKPSKSCAECRSRRTKCDMLRPSCSQCIRAHRVCKGYRDPADLVFRHESMGMLTKSRSQVQQKPLQRQVSGPSSRLNNTASTHVLVTRFTTGNTIPVSLNTSIEEQASSFFFQNYVPDKRCFPTGGLQYLEVILSREKVSQALSDGISSLGIAGLSNFWQDPNIMTSATAKYISALRQINSQLEDPDEVQSNQTFAAVMLLGMYESTSRITLQSMDAWTRHILGASALMKLRGKRQLKSSLGRDLFIHHRSQVVANSMRRGVLVPSWVGEWNDSLKSEPPAEASATILCQLYIKYTNFQGELASLGEFTASKEIVARAGALDAECANWALDLPPEYAFRSLKVKDHPEEVHLDYYDTYTSLWAAMVWNNYRCLRIRINQLMLSYLKPAEGAILPEPKFDDPALYAKQVMASEETILRCSTDICSSVPGFLAFNPNPKVERQAPRTFNGNMLLWPLYNAGLSDILPREQVEWVVGRFRLISEVMAIRQATPLLSSLSTKIKFQGWKGVRVLNEPASDKVLVAMDVDRLAAHREAEAKNPIQRQPVLHESPALRNKEDRYILDKAVYTTSDYQQPLPNCSLFIDPASRGTPQMGLCSP